MALINIYTRMQTANHVGRLTHIRISLTQPTDGDCKFANGLHKLLICHNRKLLWFPAAIYQILITIEAEIRNML